MRHSINRQQFLTGGLTGTHAPARPPWSILEQPFIERCIGCNTCWQQCPEHILSKGRGNYPIIDFNQRECTFCHRCADVCPSGAIYYKNKLPPWRVNLNIDATCLAKQGVVCSVCAEQCDSLAINMMYHLGIPTPIVDASRCNGCGACEAPCPSHSIQVSRIQFFSFPQSIQEVVV